MKKTPERRKRGGASCLCPECRGTSRVLSTRRLTGDHVWRRRQCLRTRCGRVFETDERIKEKEER